MDKHCLECKHKSISIYNDIEHCFCLNANTYISAYNYKKTIHKHIKYKTSEWIPSCMLTQASYDGNCPYKEN